MAAATEVDCKPNGKEEPTSPTTARKRRRRVPATGASEDCHTCRKRGVKCDRRRPYCSQCLEVKKDCSGYRTTLTWGVGVASRGKLRGMSLPVAKPAGQETNKPAPAQTFVRPRANTMQSPPARVVDNNGDEGPRKRMRLDPLQTNVQNFPPPSPSTQHGYFGNGYQGASTFPTWQHSSYPLSSSSQQYGFEHTFNIANQPRRSDLFPLHTTVATTFHGLPWSPDAPSQSGPSPVGLEDITPFSNYPRAPGPMPPTPRTLLSQGMHSSPTTQSMQRERPRETYQQSPAAPPMPNNANNSMANHVHFGSNSRSNSFPEQHQFSVLGSNDVQQQQQHQPYQQEEEKQEIESVRPNLKRTLSAPEVVPTEQSESIDTGPQDQFPNSMSQTLIQSFQPRMNPPSMTVSSRIWSLLEYYDKSICPVLVTFDNDSNPYRKHIMQLAMHNAGLQNAVAALVTNNMRMRCLREVPRLDDGTHKSVISKAIGVPTPEEQHYKARSIDFLNSQLSDTSKAVDDSVLATLLILCLFHVCDSGFSKFKTQLAGVQKLLRMRTGMHRNEFHGWVEMFFTWFDVMTSAVNDRETQIQGSVLDLMDLDHNLGSVEEFSGCDGRLFKLIARLGRLNLLSQQRPVREDEASSPVAAKAAPRRVDSALDFFALPTEQLDPADEWNNLMTQKDDSDRGAAMRDDDRGQFWVEWQQLQDLFYAWENSQFDGQTLDSPELSDGQRAMLQMSESFRWAALVYLERLANPTIASSSSNLQGLVEKSLYHIRAIGTKSCVTKFMLWPLFISGTECVNQEHRDLIRDRCIEIQQESGFYNNISGLEVLERVWKEHDLENSAHHWPRSHCSQQAFHWRSCMDRADGEYIVI